MLELNIKKFKEFIEDWIKPVGFAIAFAFCIWVVSEDVRRDRKKKLLNPEVVVVDHCEYFVVNGFFSQSLSHKANCSNPIHQK